MKVKATITIELDVYESNENLFGYLFKQEFLKEMVRQKLLVTAEKTFVYPGLHPRHSVDLEVIETE